MFAVFVARRNNGRSSIKVHEFKDLAASSFNTFRDEELFFKAKEPILTYYCVVKISIRRVLEERPFEIVGGIFMALISTIMLLQVHSKQKQKQLIRQYYLLICKILKEQV